ncbi:MAG TPA: phosphate ABC transporter permease PstA [Bacteroidales bacterium]|nr:phosphate ABC transporter permease PstA [Bacteroidales bacterium]HPS15736.1 phosphate ABC transporter permease PstA [Bacteroidales bacterium]
MKLKLLEEKIFVWLMKASMFIIAGGLFLIIITVLYKGLPALSWDMILKTPKGGYYLGKEGGILNAILGSLYLAAGSTILALLISLPVVIYMNVYSKKNSYFVNTLRLCFDVMWGIPSIVYGAFGFIIMIFFGLKTSLLAAIIIITIVILPVVIRSVDEVMKMISEGLFEASYSLGATKFQTARSVIIKQAMPGIITAALIAFGRAIGDAAAVLFTAGYTDYIPTSLYQSVATLPLAIFFQLGTPFPEVQQRAYASALLLVIIILVISILSRFFTSKLKKYRIS